MWLFYNIFVKYSKIVLHLKGDMRKIIIRASYDSKFESVDFRNSKAYLEMPDNVKLNAITQLIDELLVEKEFLIDQTSVFQDAA